MERTLKVKRTIQISLSLLGALSAGYWAGNTHGYAAGVKSGSHQERQAWITSPSITTNNQVFFKGPYAGRITRVITEMRSENTPEPRELPLR